MKVILVLPIKPEPESSHLNKKIISFDVHPALKIKHVASNLLPYTNISPGREKNFGVYNQDIFCAVEQFCQLAQVVAKQERFDFIHAHDWMTFPAGIAVKEMSKKPLFVHIHSTEFDRTGGNGRNDEVFATEKRGMQKADKVIAVSDFTQRKIVMHYHIDKHKIEVVHNGIEVDTYSQLQHHNRSIDNQLVLFLGRLTLQKGPDYFVAIAQKVLSRKPDVLFVIAGSGDMKHSLMEKIAANNLADKILFTGFLRGEEVRRIYAMADIFVMPSVSEPFGLSALEAMASGVPVIISKQSGLGEATLHTLKVDFWDIDKAASYILALLEYSCLRMEISKTAQAEAKKFSWDTAAQRCLELYHQLS